MGELNLILLDFSSKKLFLWDVDRFVEKSPPSTLPLLGTYSKVKVYKNMK